MINVGTVAIILFALLWQYRRIRRKFENLKLQQADDMARIFETLSGILRSQQEQTKHTIELEQNTIRALQEICQALNEYFKTTGQYMNLSSCALRNIVTCMLPLMDELKEWALDDEDYEKVQEIVNIILNLQQLLKS